MTLTSYAGTWIQEMEVRYIEVTNQQSETANIIHFKINNKKQVKLWITLTTIGFESGSLSGIILNTYSSGVPSAGTKLNVILFTPVSTTVKSYGDDDTKNRDKFINKEHN